MSNEPLAVPAASSINPSTLTPGQLSVVRPEGAAIATALARAQGAMQNIGKDRDVEVKSEKGKYTFRYATLAAMWTVIRKPLAENGLAVVQLPTVKIKSPTEGSVDIETRILHISGESIVGHFELPTGKRDPQGLGGVVSYAKRYALAAMLGLASEDETADVDETGQAQFSGNQAPPPKAAAPTVSHVQLGMALQSAATRGELSTAAAAVAKAKNLTRAQLDELRALHVKRKAELDAGVTGPTTVAEPGAGG